MEDRCLVETSNPQAPLPSRAKLRDLLALEGHGLQLSFLMSCSAVTSTCTEGPMVEVT
jgi:hypothetical protein